MNRGSTDRARATAVPLAALSAVVFAMWRFAQVEMLDAIGGLVSVYLLGWVVGALLVETREAAAGAGRPDDRAADPTLPWMLLRLLAGLILSALAFLLSLVLALPWFVGPSVAVAAAIVGHRRAAFTVPIPRVRLTSSDVAALLVALVLQAPIVVSAFRMAPGPFPPVFFHVDTPYSLEKVHSLTKTSVYPPESLSNAGGRPPYHYGVHGLAAILSRTSGLPAHHSLFLFVLPLLAGGTIAAAFLLARALGPAVASLITVPLLLLRVPSPWYAFWDVVGPLLSKAWLEGSFEPLDTLTADYQVWGPASIVAHNVAAEFVTLASLAALATAPARGWRLAVFLIGTAIVMKVPTGVALLAGFVVMQGYRVLARRNPRALGPAIAVAAICAVCYLAFFAVSAQTPSFKVVPWLFFHLEQAQEHEQLGGLAADLLWVLAPVALASWGKGSWSSSRGVWLLSFAIAPLAVVNLSSSVDARPGGSGQPTDDWVQALIPVPIVLHAFVIAVLSDRWHALGRRRLAIVAFLSLTIVQPVLVTGRYLGVLLFEPEKGHEFADNQSIAEALATIPVRGSVIVTNDLRYPADGFSRDNRQMQVPAIFGHQAFAVNYAYERFHFSSARLELHAPLQRNEWNDTILAAARTHGWTHFLVHKNYTHADMIPLEQTFSNRDYAVYRFAGLAAPPQTAAPGTE
jgi:hypothetical protein